MANRRVLYVGWGLPRARPGAERAGLTIAAVGLTLVLTGQMVIVLTTETAGRTNLVTGVTSGVSLVLCLLMLRRDHTPDPRGGPVDTAADRRIETSDDMPRQ